MEGTNLSKGILEINRLLAFNLPRDAGNDLLDLEDDLKDLHIGSSTSPA